MGEGLAPSNHDRLYLKANSLLEGQLPLHGVRLPRLNWFSRRRVRTAIALFERVLQINPQNWAALWLTGLAYRRLDEKQASLDCFVRSHELNPTQPDVAREAGIAAMDLRRPDLAIRFTARAVEANPKDAGLIANLALAHLFNGSPQAAHEIATRALQADPSDEITQRIVALAADVLAGKRRCPTHIHEV